MSNAYQRLSGLLKPPARTIATVVNVHNNGTTTVRHSNGSFELVLGDSIASGKVYIKDGELVAQAADLPYSEVEI
ncbi:hypothetical protein Q4519_14710 [Motilimonas sp. 1_MG-2023]|uniref:hypothetical protein n=1 Tax=Motilimonas sp. 1_MG-2023 TaxID=3062672 RepID=UPI0026E2733C|nr:hypothetical protein [Motilimonas sp. 1_MG-2023]MDO6526935.1 hypothetical protein [Motilimonas sp. 1_MG-2023]